MLKLIEYQVMFNTESVAIERFDETQLTPTELERYWSWKKSPQLAQIQLKRSNDWHHLCLPILRFTCEKSPHIAYKTHSFSRFLHGKIILAMRIYAPCIIKWSSKNVYFVKQVAAITTFFFIASKSKKVNQLGFGNTSNNQIIRATSNPISGM